MHKGKRNFFAIVLTLLIALGLPKLSSNSPRDKVNASATETVYLKVNDNWKIDNARFAAWVWNPGTWFDLTQVEGETHIYKADIPTWHVTG